MPRRRAGGVLRQLLASGKFFIVPCAHDALSARIIHRSGHFPAVFNSGFGIAASHGLPDTGLMSFAEVLRAHVSIRQGLPADFPVFADGDDGYGNAMNVKRTVRAFEEAGIAAIMLEDQVNPKQCGHTTGKQVIGRDEAVSKIQAAVDARAELRAFRGVEEDFDDILILARTDARATHGLEEAIQRLQEFKRIGADIVFLEAPQSVDEMRSFCQQVEGPKMVNCLSKGQTPNLAPNELAEMGFAFAAYPFDVLLAMINSVESTLEALTDFSQPASEPDAATMQKLWDITGFNQYMKEQARYGCQDFKRGKGE